MPHRTRALDTVVKVGTVVTLVTVAMLALVIAPPARAHDLWIEPSAFRPAVGTEVTARLRVGEHLRGDALARNPALVDRFVLRGQRREVALAGAPGQEPAGAARPAEPGLHWIGYQSHAFPMVLPADKFESYLNEEGLERIVERRARSGQSAAPGRERFFRCAKSLLDVAPGQRSEDSGLATTPLGFILELVPGLNPYALALGGELPLSLRFRGAPIAGVKVVAVNQHDPARFVSARTDASGFVALRLAEAGLWLVKAVHMEAAPPGAGVDWESWWASLTFELRSGP